MWNFPSKVVLFAMDMGTWALEANYKHIFEN